MRALALLLAVLAASPVQAQSVADRIEDLRRATAVRLALLGDAETRRYDVAVQAADGAVVLSGLVPTLGAREQVEAVVLGVSGVRVVRNDLRLQGQPDQPILDLEPIREPDEDVLELNDRDAADAMEQETERTETPSGDGAVYHVVEHADTLYAIARRYGTTVEALLRLNNLTSPDIRIGQRLRVR